MNKLFNYKYNIDNKIMFFCNILKQQVNNDNIENWKKNIKLLIVRKGGIIPLFKKILKRYKFNDIEEYINFIESNINNQDELDRMNSLYELNLSKERKIEELNEKKRIGLTLLNSIKYHNADIKIRMLLEKDIPNICDLYYDFKINYLKEIHLTQKECNEWIDDFILKNQIYGIFDKRFLTGFMICDYKKFNMDFTENKEDTFYIQEIIIDKKFKGKNYGSLLITYAILICPPNLHYISFMTKEDNKAMEKIAKKFNFIKQEKSSGDPENPILYIRINNHIDRTFYNQLNYLKSITLSYISN